MWFEPASVMQVEKMFKGDQYTKLTYMSPNFVELEDFSRRLEAVCPGTPAACPGTPAAYPGAFAVPTAAHVRLWYISHQLRIVGCM